MEEKSCYNSFLHKLKSLNMKLELDANIIKNHKQKYANSCVPMAIELVLKLNKVVTMSYYDLQKEKKNFPRGFSEFDGKTINNVKISLDFKINRDQNFPLEDLFNKIQKELDKGRYVTCAWKDELMQSYHAYVIYGYEDDEFLALTTDFGRSEYEYITDMKTRLKDIYGSDILTFDIT